MKPVTEFIQCAQHISMSPVLCAAFPGAKHYMVSLVLGFQSLLMYRLHLQVQAFNEV